MVSETFCCKLLTIKLYMQVLYGLLQYSKDTTCKLHVLRLFLTGNCYSKVKAETEKMKRSMGLDRFNYYHPDKEVVYLYEDDEREARRFGDKVVVEVNDQRPKWWTKSMLSKSHTES